MVRAERLLENKESEDKEQGQNWSILSNLAKSPRQSYIYLTNEKTKHYIEDRLSDNIDIFEQEVKDSAFLELYENIVTEYPILRTVVLKNEDLNSNAYFSSMSKLSDGTYVPAIVCNMSHPETYAFDANENLETLSPVNDRLGTAYFIKRLAFAIGADWKKCAKNVRLNADATLLHELGHAHDFLENYLRPEYEKISGHSRGTEALYYAVKAKTANRTEFQKHGPNPDGQWLRRSSKEWKNYERRLKAMGIDNYDEYRYAVHQYYRDMPDEAYADQFAYNYIIKHYDDYFTIDENEHSGRIFVDKTKEIELDPDFAHILGLKQGLGVEIDRLDEDGKSTKHIKGFLASNMYVGKNVYLYENGDPKNPGEKWRIAEGVSEISLKPIIDENNGDIKHYVFFKDLEGTKYHISRTKEEAMFVDASPTEVVDDLGLKVGEKVQLIKHLTKTDARTMTRQALKAEYPNWLIDGVVKCVGTDEHPNLVIGFRENGYGDPLNLALPPKRKWKTYYMGNYEILPLPNTES